jgi:phosphorylcholine metabolism protein LicD
MIDYIKKILRPVKYFIVYLYALFIRYKNKFFNNDTECNKYTQRCSENKKSTNYKYELFGENTPQCCATNLYNILKDLVLFFNENNIEYFISFGTLLGAIRHKGMIPWDTDIDIVISEKDQKKVFDKLNKHFSKKYDIAMDKYQGMIGDIIRVNYSNLNKLHVDIFIYKTEKDNIKLGLNETLPKKIIFPLKEVQFYNLIVKAPNDTNYFLKHFFGQDYMEYAYKQWSLFKIKFKLDDFRPAKIRDEK